MRSFLYATSEAYASLEYRWLMVHYFHLLSLKKIFLQTITFSPSKAFVALKANDIYVWAVWLLIIRCEVTSLLTVTNMYIHNSPMFFNPPFGIDEDTYRFYEIFWYGPYVALLILVITWSMTFVSKKIFRVHCVSFRKVFQIYTLSVFVPWLITIPGDYIAVVIFNAEPAYFIPFHLTIQAWTSVLIVTGFRVIYNTSAMQGIFLGFMAWITTVPLNYRINSTV